MNDPEIDKDEFEDNFDYRYPSEEITDINSDDESDIDESSD